MSSNVLKIFPVDPSCRPKATERRSLVRSVQSLLRSRPRINIVEQDDPFFVDQGANFERVMCPSCGEEIDASWWTEAMTTASSAKFRDLVVTTPCCNSRVSLNDLKYEWPAGFARFVIEVQDPADDLQSGEIMALEEIVGCKLRTIWAHY